MEGENTSPKKHLRPCDQIINRIRWDSLYDKSKLVIGYLDRFIGAQVCTLEEFAIGDIPYHRIIQLTYDSKLVWDRETRLDLITCDTVQEEKNQQKQEKLKPEVVKSKKNKQKKGIQMPEEFDDGDWVSDDEDQYYEGNFATEYKNEILINQYDKF